MNTAHLPFVCRPGTRKDIPAIMQIMDCAFAPAFGEAWTRPQVEGMLDLPGTWLTVAASDDDIVGFSLMRSVLDERSEEHTSELQSLMRISYAVFCLKKK